MLAYCLPSHTSGKTQPLDAGLYGPFKKAGRRELKQAAKLYGVPTFEQFDLLHLIRRSYEKRFVQASIKSTFLRAVVWPVNTAKRLGCHRSKSAEQADSMLSPDKLEFL